MVAVGERVQGVGESGVLARLRFAIDPRRWLIWEFSRSVLTFVFVVVGAAVAVLGLSTSMAGTTGQTWLWFGLLLAGLLLHIEVSHRIEGIREVSAEGSPHPHPQDIWIFAGVLLLPFPLVAVIVAVNYARACHRPPHRRVFTAATVIIACWAARLVLSIPVGLGTRVPLVTVLNGPRGLLLVMLAALAYFVLNYGLVVAVIMLTNPQAPGSKALGDPINVLIIGAAVGLGAAVALIMSTRPWLLPILMLTVVALNVGVLAPYFRIASRTDTKTGLAEPVFWHQKAKAELERIRNTGTGMGVLIIDLDHFKRINDRYGHLVGDQVLRAVAATMKREVRGFDLVGRLGGEEFAVFVPGTTSDAVRSVAERLRAAIRLTTVTATAMDGTEVHVNDLSASIGVARYPESGDDLVSLLMAADSAMYTAKRDGRDRISVAAARSISA